MQTLRGRVLTIGLVSGLFGVLTAALIVLLTSSATLLRHSAPLLAWLMEHGERARCEAAPEHFSLEGPQEARIWAYDGVTLESHNPDAPRLSAELRRQLGRRDLALERLGFGHGGIAAARTAKQGACAIMTSQWQPAMTPRELGGMLAVGFLLAGLLGAAVAAVAAARPLRQLESAHAQIRADAAALARARDELRNQVADVAHDIRTPIASLQLALEQALGAGGDATAVSACLLRAVDDVVYVGGLIGNLRLASELRAGAGPMTGTAHLHEIVERAAVRAKVLARQKQIVLEVAVPERGIDVAGDAIAIAQAVGNVIDNAVAHGFAGGHVAVLLELVGAREFELTVVDDGPGVAPAELPRLGERTFRTDAARARDARGHGLGLAISAEVCRRLSWRLSFAPEEPRGLRVTIRGPIEAQPR